MPTVMTTGGPVAAQDLGAVLPHEHLLVNTIRENRSNGLLGDVELMAEEVALFAAAGGGTVVEVTPAEIAQGTYIPLPGAAAPPARPDPGPQTRPPEHIRALLRIAAAAGVRLVLGTGHYRDPYLDRDWFDRNGVDAIAEGLVRDLEEGFPGTGVRAGIIGEIGSERWYVSAPEERSFRAAARAHLRTGATITTHAARWPVGLAQLEILTAEGVDPRRVVIGHCDMVPSADYHLALARQGAYVQFDTFHQCGGSHRALRTRIEAIMALVRAGHLDRILLSHDVFLTTHLSANGGVGLDFLATKLPPALAEVGLDAEEIAQLLVGNPQRALAG